MIKFTLLFCVAVLLVACGGSSSNESKSDTTLPSPGPSTVSITPPPTGATPSSTTVGVSIPAPSTTVPSAVPGGTVAAGICWTTSQATVVQDCPVVNTQGLRLTIASNSWTFSGLPQSVVVAGGTLTAVPNATSPLGAGTVTLLVGADGVLSVTAGELTGNTGYILNGALSFANAPIAQIIDKNAYVERFFGWGSPNSIVPTAASATTNCVGTAANPQSYTSVGSFKVYEGDCVAAYTLASAEWAKLLSSNGAFRVDKIEQLFHGQFKDSFDFIFFVIDQNGIPPGFQYYGRYATAGTRYPSRTRRYLGNMILPFASSSTSGTIANLPTLHEIAHEWGNLGLVPNAADFAHWGFSSVGGQLGGFSDGTLVQVNGTQWQAKGPGNTCLANATMSELSQCQPRTSFGTFANGGNSIPYSKLELFSMGLIPAAQVPDVRVALDGAWVDAAKGIFSASNWQTLTASSIAAGAGARIAPNATGQRHFRIATVVLTPNQILDATTLAALNQFATEFSADGVPPSNGSGGVVYLQNFHTATNRLATLRAGGLVAEKR